MGRTSKALPRIVSLVPSVTNVLFELGATKCLVGVTRWCHHVVPELTDTKRLISGDCWSADAAKVAKLRPDLVIGGVPYGPEVVKQLLARGVRLLATSPRTLEDIYGDIRTIASVVGKPRQGERVIARMRREMARVSRQSAKAQKRPRVYCEVWPNPLRTCEPWVAEMVEAAGGQFVPRGAGRAVTSREVTDADPEVIVLAWAATGARARPQAVRARPGWSRVAAVRGNRIHVIRDEWLNTPAPILMQGLGELAQWIHPELFRSSPATMEER